MHLVGPFTDSAEICLGVFSGDPSVYDSQFATSLQDSTCVSHNTRYCQKTSAINGTFHWKWLTSTASFHLKSTYDKVYIVIRKTYKIIKEIHNTFKQTFFLWWLLINEGSHNYTENKRFWFFRDVTPSSLTAWPFMTGLIGHPATYVTK